MTDPTGDALRANHPDEFPILLGHGARANTPTPTISWAFLMPYEDQARKNHSDQSLVTLARRGGLDWTEVAAILSGRDWCEMDEQEAEAQVRAKIAEWEARA